MKRCAAPLRIARRFVDGRRLVAVARFGSPALPPRLIDRTLYVQTLSQAPADLTQAQPAAEGRRADRLGVYGKTMVRR